MSKIKGITCRKATLDDAKGFLIMAYEAFISDGHPEYNFDAKKTASILAHTAANKKVSVFVIEHDKKFIGFSLACVKNSIFSDKIKYTDIEYEWVDCDYMGRSAEKVLKSSIKSWAKSVGV